uniref:LOW QUALITY PROTEIN: uncharacterized protein LOC100175442 n=1 Tax=Ciona intestinalis TaxID=7719 RepID=UPI000EF48254|nr:LOW QUALITY PROTEIN: uncharacterized protein LOC100175442 [Ciona intestinalis]|eukprot:XP_026693515.1 LOW QUALITY PROTEIN: uncharacterized protein LOC100175442 [Ciona intestinalis]
MVKDKSGKRVAVFFMDTQGMFDHKTTGKGCSAIFAMSTLLSSMQIYNLSGHIQEDHLQYLEIFTNYARYAVEQKQHANASTCPFQGLMFLLRNWEMADYQFGQQGGDEYLATVMEEHLQENVSVRQNMSNSFSDIGCTLMPHPGKNVARRKTAINNNIELSDIDEEFLDEVYNLAKYLFNQESLIVKKLDGITITGEGLIDLAIEYAKILSGGEVPKVVSMLQANLKAQFIQFIRQLESEHEDFMDQQVGSVYIFSDKLEEMHEDQLVKASNAYRKRDILDKEESKANKDKMERNMRIAYWKAISKNEKTKEGRMQLIREKIEIVSSFYKNQLEKCDRYKSEETLGTIRRKAVSKFHELTGEYESHLVKQHISPLDRELDLIFEEYEQQRKKLEEEDENVLAPIITRLRENYIQAMDKAVDGKIYIDNLNKVHDTAFTAMMKELDENEECRNTKKKSEKRRKLEHEANNHFIRLRTQNEKIIEKEVLPIINKAKEEYRKASQASRDTYVLEEEIQSGHKIAEKAARGIVENSCAGKETWFVQKCREHVKSFSQYELQALLRKNNMRKAQATQRFFQKRLYLAKEYFKNNFATLQNKYVDQEVLEKMHEKGMKMALSTFQTYSGPPLEEFTEQMVILKVEVEKLFKQAKANNRRIEIKIKQKLNQFYEKLAVDYLTMMGGATRKRYISLKALVVAHCRFKELLIAEVEKAIRYEQIRESCIESCKVVLEKEFKEVVGNTSQPEEETGGWFKALGTQLGALTGLMNVTINVSMNNLASVAYLKGLGLE